MSRRKGIEMKLHVVLVICLLTAFMGTCGHADAVKGTVMCPVVTGRPEKLPFAGHPGWLDVYSAGDSIGRSSRIGADGGFDVAELDLNCAAVASFDHLEVLPIFSPVYPVRPTSFDLEIWGDYICNPPGYPDVWDKEYMHLANDFYQTFVASSSQIYNISGWDGPKVVWWGNKANTAVNVGGPDGEVILVEIFGQDAYEDHMTSHISDHTMIRTGFRHTDIPVTPRRRYAVRVGGYRHGGQHQLNTFVRPDKGDGYVAGRAFRNNVNDPMDGDLCLIVQGNSNGQIVENQIRDEEWELMLPKRKPVTRWGQTFLNHGKSMAGLVFWATNGSDAPMTCTARLREDGPEGKVIGPSKTARGHDVSGVGPFFRYAHGPGALEGYEHFYRIAVDPLGKPVPPEEELMCEAGHMYNIQLFQVAFVPDELPLEPGKSYYVDLQFSKPVLMVVDGMFYPRGYGYYDGLKITKEIEHPIMFHSDRWTLGMSIVTYANEGGAAN